MMDLKIYIVKNKLEILIMIKNAVYSFSGANQDITRSKHAPQYYFDAQHIRIVSTDSQSTGSVSNELGNTKVISIPDIDIDLDNQIISYGDRTLPYANGEITERLISSEQQVIIGHTETREGVVLFTTNNDGVDAIWIVRDVLNEVYDLELLYVRDLGFSTSNPIQALFNYENDNLLKVYWVDGVNQLRSINTIHSIDNGDNEELIDVPSTTLNNVGNFNISQPVVESVTTGGIHTSGVIQYSYNLYKLNASQTASSPLSTLVSLDRGFDNGGGDVNEQVGAIPIVRINDIDLNYTNLRLYSIKYTSLNELPSISLILDTRVTDTSLVYYDDGSIINPISVDEFTFLGSNPTIPNCIESKDNRLLVANVRDNSFNVDLDLRAYSFPINSDRTFIYENIELNNGNITGDELLITNGNFTVPERYDAVNLDYDNVRYQPNSTIQGGEGEFIKYELNQINLNDVDQETIDDSRFFKSDEIYRIGVQFYNRVGQRSFVNWMADFKAPKGNLDGNYNTLKVELKPEFYTWLNTTSNFESENDRPAGYKIVRARRGLNDRTILYQGVLSPMMFQIRGAEAQTANFPIDITDHQEENTKIPSYFIRNFENTADLGVELGNNVTTGTIVTGTTVNMNQGRGQIVRNLHGSRLNAVEIHSNTATSGKVSQTFQFTKMMQLQSPELLFDFASTREDLQLRVKGLLKRESEFIQSSEINTITQLERNGGRFEFFPNRQFIDDNDMFQTFRTPDSDSNPRFIGPSGNEDTTDHYQMFREYKDIIFDTDNSVYDIYGSPEITERGQGSRNYFNDSRFNYSNSLQSFISDQEDDCDECDEITSLNSWGNRALTIVLGNDNNIPTSNRPGIENLYQNSSITDPQGVLTVDVTIPDNNIYLNNIYGGISFESKRRTVYLEIGEYTDIFTDNVQINSPGDTFINTFNFLRITRTDTQVLNSRTPQITEIVSFPVETTVDLKNRNDLSRFDWDNRFQPSNEDYHNYNRVYSQEGDLLTNFSEPDNFRRINNFDVRIQASRPKIPNEEIDSWTEILTNELLDLDGEYGPINSIKIYNDRLVSFQDKAIANVVVNPRIQVQSDDGVSIELGRGTVLYDFDYITTKSGTVNKWSVIEGKRGIYYYDTLNKGIGRVPDATNILLSDAKGMHSFFNNNHNYSDLIMDNPILKRGVRFGYHNYNNDVYFTVHLGEDNESFTWCYNELKDEFVDLKTYTPSIYMNQGDKLLLTDPDNTNVYQHELGEYNVFFEKHQPSFITLMVNPESHADCVFNNIMFKSELYLDDVDQPNKTLTGIQAYNEYQDTGMIPLKLSRNLNLRRKFRDWKANIPREGRDRIRNPWMFLKLELTNEENYRMILHDIVVYYSTY